jgi:carboxyl-terminal processing protease
MRYYTPKGRSIQATGIAPDVAVEAGYKPDTSFGITRESDLDNHLSGDGSTPRSETPTFKPPTQEEEEIGVSPTYLGVARVIPKNPAGGPDFALSIGYQIINGILKKQ